MNKYEIIAALGLPDLELEVNKCIDKGYVVHGFLLHVNGWFIQPMIKQDNV